MTALGRSVHLKFLALETISFWRGSALAVLLALGVVGQTSAATFQVAAGGDVQAALDHPKPGDQIVLQAGVTFVGPFVLRNVNADSDGHAADGAEIVIRTSTPDDQLPAGQRVTPADAAKMARLEARGGPRFSGPILAPDTIG